MKSQKTTEESEPKLDNLKAVVKYLTEAGWRIKRSTIYYHQDKGLLRPDKEGKYSQAAVDKYVIVAKLKRLDGKKTEKLEKLSEDRQSAETRKLNAQAEREELKLKVEKGLFVPKDTFERELAHRAMVFKTDGEAFFRSQASAMIKLTGGDPEKAPDLIEFGLNAFAGWLNRYLVDREFSVPNPVVDQLEDPDEDKEEAAEE
jgi:hypothetical protein